MYNIYVALYFIDIGIRNHGYMDMDMYYEMSKMLIKFIRW